MYSSVNREKGGCERDIEKGEGRVLGRGLWECEGVRGVSLPSGFGLGGGGG